MALNIKVGPIGALDMLKFKNQVKKRNQIIDSTTPAPLPEEYGTNARARALHPKAQTLLVKEVRQHQPDVKSYLLGREDGEPTAYFRAGQYLSVRLSIGGSEITRPYSISSAPQLALQGNYWITVKRTSPGFASDYILEHWQEETAVNVSGPEGEFYYEPLRDAKTVIGLAGGSGITPFLSMAYAIRDAAEDFNLTVLYGSRTKEDILFADEFAAIEKECPKVHLVNVLSDEEKEGMEHGFLTASLIQKYAGEEPFSVFACGPSAMYHFLDTELPKLNLEQKYIRRELLGAEKQPWTLPGYPTDKKDQIFQLTVKYVGNEKVIEASANEPVLVAIERAGIAAPSHCRSGECGYCHSRLVSGEVYIPEVSDGRRAADKEYGYIHPCASYPISDLVIELPGVY